MQHLVLRCRHDLRWIWYVLQAQAWVVSNTIDLLLSCAGKAVAVLLPSLATFVPIC